MIQIDFLKFSSLSRLVLLVLVCCFCFAARGQVFNEETESLLEQVVHEIDKKSTYTHEKRNRIAGLKYKLAAVPEGDLEKKYEQSGELYLEYQSFQFDSAFYYAKQRNAIGYALNDVQRIDLSKVELSFVLMSGGMFKETFDSLKTVNVNNLTGSARVDFYALFARAYYDLGDFNKDQYYSPYYVRMAGQYVDSARAISPSDSYADLYLNGLKNMRTFQGEAARDDLNKLMLKDNLTPHEYAIVTSSLSFIELSFGDTVRAIKLLAHSAINDIQSATREVSAMTTLAQLLYAKGETDYAYTFINSSMEDAEFYGARLRKIDVGSILPLIASSKLRNVEVQRQLLIMYSIGITLFVLLVVIFVFIILRQYRMLKKADEIIKEANAQLMLINLNLSEANTIKEEYIGYYFNITSDYLEKIEKFKRSVEIKLLARKYEELDYIVSNINLKKERASLYASFDKVFLKMFPDFIQIFNSYFHESDQFELEDDQILNTELRLFALIRMGISDNDKLAKILGYSINTIYAYKNRIKSKSILPNEEFEQRIMEIKAI